MRFLKALILGIPLLGGACGGSASAPLSPSSGPTMTGFWAGAASDSTGSMMGAGLTGEQMSNAQWMVTQNGASFSGTMQFPGYMMGRTMMVTGTVIGHTGTFTMTIPAGSMMMAGCTATASGTFDVDDMMTQMHGSYSGMNSCTGAFSQGQLSMRR